MKYGFVRYWFRFLSRPWINTDILVNILFISKTSSRRLQDMSWRRLQDVFETYLQDVFKTSSRRLEDVVEDKRLLCWRHVEDVLKTCLEDIFKASWRPTNVCWAYLCRIYVIYFFILIFIFIMINRIVSWIQTYLFFCEFFRICPIIFGL